MQLIFHPHSHSGWSGITSILAYITNKYGYRQVRTPELHRQASHTPKEQAHERQKVCHLQRQSTDCDSLFVLFSPSSFLSTLFCCLAAWRPLSQPSAT